MSRAITMTLLIALGLVALAGVCLKAVNTHAWRIDLVKCDTGRKEVIERLVVMDRNVESATARAREYGSKKVRPGAGVCAGTVEYLGRRPWDQFGVKPLETKNP